MQAILQQIIRWRFHGRGGGGDGNAGADRPLIIA